MKLDEFAFFNQQLAAMLRDGIPLESALGQLCASMRRGDLRDELEKLRADLANGVPLDQALASRKLPSFYVQTLQAAAKSNDLPGILTLVADYYQRASLLSTRLKGLMVYPLILLVSTFLLSVWLAVFEHELATGVLGDMFEGRPWPMPLGLLWAIPTLLAAVIILVVVFLSAPQVRQWLRWKAPAFHEASLATIASTVSTLLRSGCTFDQALTLAQQMESASPAGREIAQWRQRLASGQTPFTALAQGGAVFPGLFVWLVANSREDPARGFQRAAEIYQSRSAYKTDMMLYAALPVAVLVIGILVLCQVYWLFGALAHIIAALSG
jgi:type II secretory pathway component PulF